MLCAGSHVLQQDQPDNANSYAAEGTAAHQVLTWAGQQNKNAADFKGTFISLDDHGRVLPPDSSAPHTWQFLVDDDMAEHVQVCLDYVREIAGDNPVLYDVKVNYASYLGVPEEDGWGTADVIILLPDEIVVVDFKYGMGVEVQAGYDVPVETAASHGVERNPNPQMACYGLGALTAYRDFGDFERARLVISQPRITKKPNEYDLTIADLERWGNEAARAAVEKCQRAEAAFESVRNRKHWDDAYLTPGEKQCRFCKAKATCPALRNEVASTVFGAQPATPDEFAAVGISTVEQIVQQADMGDGINGVRQPIADVAVARWLSVCLQQVDLIEDWCKGIRTEVERRLLAGESVPDFKLVPGKKGNRQFASEQEAETLLKSFRLKLEEMYDFKLISPTTAEKRAKAGVIGPRQWTKLQEIIVQKEGKPHVAHVSDPRPALVVSAVADEFTDVSSTEPAQDGCAWIR